MTTKEIGIVKWFNVTKGFGFIIPADGGKDVFVHVTALKEAGLETVVDGQPIEFIRTGSDDRPKAVNLRLIEPTFEQAIVAWFDVEKNFGFVKLLGADGDYIQAFILPGVTRAELAEGDLVEVLWQETGEAYYVTELRRVEATVLRLSEGDRPKKKRQRLRTRRG